jgi:hypothetical protein
MGPRQTTRSRQTWSPNKYFSFGTALYRWDDTVHSYACTGWVLNRDSQTADTGCQIRYHIFGEQSQWPVCSRRDNGYMAFSFHRPSRKEAQIIEDIMRYDFSKIAVLNSYEYVDTTAAPILGVEFDSTSYDSYVGVAQALYKYMLRLVHTVWSRNSHMYGYRMTSSPQLLSTTSRTIRPAFTVIWASMLVWLMKNARLHLEKHVLTPPPLVEEDGSWSHDEDAWGHRTPWWFDSRRCSRQRSQIGERSKMHEKFDKFVDEMCIIDPEGLTGNSKWQPTFVCGLENQTWFVSEHEQLHGQAIR